MNALPIDIVRMILSYRGTDGFEALSHEMDTTKKYTEKYRKDILARVINADDDGIITYKEMQILFKHKAIYRKRVLEPWEKNKHAIHPDH